MVTTNYRVTCVRDRNVHYNAQSIDDSEKAANAIRSLIDSCGQNDRENLVVLMLDVKNKIIGTNIVHIGDVSSCKCSPKDVLRPAILLNAAGIIIGHNHPSNSLHTSVSDDSMTELISSACRIMRIAMHDHIIVTDESFYSYLAAQPDRLK